MSWRIQQSWPKNVLSHRRPDLSRKRVLCQTIVSTSSIRTYFFTLKLENRILSQSTPAYLLTHRKPKFPHSYKRKETFLTYKSAAKVFTLYEPIYKHFLVHKIPCYLQGLFKTICCLLKMLNCDHRQRQ